MKEITLSSHVHHVISEPGDGTRYSYLVYQDGPDKFCFMPAESTFKYPQRLSKWAVLGKDEKALLQVDYDEGCNYYTLLEYIRTIEELEGEKEHAHRRN